jgi:hypothetical protein
MHDAIPEGLFETKKIVETAAMKNIRRVRKILTNPMNSKYFSPTAPWGQRSSWNTVERADGKVGLMHVSPTAEFYKASTCPLCLTDYAAFYVMDDKEDIIPPGMPYKGIERLDNVLKHVYNAHIVGRDGNGNKVPPMSHDAMTYIYGICDAQFCGRHPDVLDFFRDNIDYEISYYNEEEDRKHKLVVFPVVISPDTWKHGDIKAFNMCKTSRVDDRSREVKKEEAITGIVVSDIPQAVDANDRDGGFVHAIRKLEPKRGTEMYTYKTYVDNLDNLGLDKWWYVDAMANFAGRYLSRMLSSWLDRDMYTYAVGVRKDTTAKFKPIDCGKFIDRISIKHMFDTYAKRDEFKFFIYSSEFAKLAREKGAEKYYAQEYVSAISPYSLAELEVLSCVV